MKNPQAIRLPVWLKAYEDAIVSARNFIGVIRAHEWILDKPEHKALHSFFNRSLFAALNNYDLLIALKYLDVSSHVKNVGETNYFARIAALHLHEIYNDLNKIIDRELRKTIESQVGPEDISKINVIYADLNSLKGSHLEHLQLIRHNAIGHRDADAVKQSDIIKVTDVKMIQALATKTVGLLIKISGFYTSILEKITSPTSK